MPTLDLLDHTAHPDGWHNVRSPGGYEWWYFDAEDPTTDTQLVAILMEGFIFHPGYIRAYERFRKRPTRHRPPVASDFPCAYLCVYRHGKILSQFFTQYRPEQFAAAKDRPAHVTIGPNTLRTDTTGHALELTGTPWTLTARGPVTHTDRTLSASLHFAPVAKHAPIERTFLSREMTGADHHWTIAAPHCDVRGTIRLTGGDAETIEFTGRGYHDHNYGTAPIGDGLQRWTWGRAAFEGTNGNRRVVTFHYAEPRDVSREPEIHVVELDASGEPRERKSLRVEADWSLTCKPAMMLRYPKSLRFVDLATGENVLDLTEPRVLDPSPFYMRLTYAGRAQGSTSTAFCELAYPHRLRWPILGRMIEMSFDKRPTRPR
jgi:carotenoid 1,2-hydratase